MSPSPHHARRAGRWLIGTGLGAVLAVAACSGAATRSARPAVTTAPAPPAAGASSTAGTSPPSAPAGVDQGATDYLPSELPAGPATPDPAAAADAVARAGAFMVAFARTDLPQAQWWAGIAPYFTVSAVEVYHWTDVRNVSVSGVDPVGATLLPASTRYIAQVAVPAADGVWTVKLVRVGAQWQVERAAQPPR